MYVKNYIHIFLRNKTFVASDKQEIHPALIMHEAWEGKQKLELKIIRKRR
jgi:hypothetical protein